MDRKKAYQLLGILPGDSLEKARVKYRIKAKQCHPDRFGHDPRLMKAAEIEMTQINIAYQVACTQLQSNKKTSDINHGIKQNKRFIPWLSWFHWSIKIGKPLLQKVEGLWGTWPAPRIKADPPDKPTRETHPHMNAKKKSFDEILQQKVADMKKDRYCEK
ncbi:MAG: J domain-containing protein [Desulfobacterium sp.]